MNTIKFVHIYAFLALLLSFTVSVTAADAQTVHALLIIMDDDDKIGKSVDIDRKRMKQLLGVVQNEIGEVKTTTLLSSKDTATRDEVLSWVQNINAESNDIVFIHYSGHGGMNPNGETFLVTEGKWLFRAELVNALERVKLPRLTLLITDCCSSLVQSDIEPKLQSSRSMTRLTQRVLQNLFLEHKGFLHVTGATEGQYSWTNNVSGGWFTKNLINALDSNPDENKDSFLTWKEVFEKARENTEKTFSQAIFTTKQREDMKRKGINNQTPKAYSLPTPMDGKLNSDKTPIDGKLNSDKLKTLNYIFIVLVLCTLGISSRISRNLKKQHAGRVRLSSHRSKVFAVLTIEVLIWIGFNLFWQFFISNWLFICIGGVVIIGRILTQKRKQYV